MCTRNPTAPSSRSSRGASPCIRRLEPPFRNPERVASAARPSSNADPFVGFCVPAQTLRRTVCHCVASSRSSAPQSQGQAAQPNLLTVDPTERSSLLLAAGEQVTVTEDAAQKTANPNIAGATAWRDREIVFESATLSDVAEEFNRYNQRQLVVVDPSSMDFTSAASSPRPIPTRSSNFCASDRVCR